MKGLNDMRNFKNLIVSVWRDEGGISSVEYALILGLLGGSIAVAASVLGGAVGIEMTDAGNCVGGDVAACNN